jgi:hypothetical protein
MSDSKGNAVERLQAFIDAYLESLQQQPEDEVLGLPQERAGDCAKFADIVEKAKRAAGKRRLQEARRALNQQPGTSRIDEPVDLAAARRFIAQAVNDRHYTLAARDLTNMSDDDVLRIYRQLRDLGISSPRKKS